MKLEIRNEPSLLRAQSQPQEKGVEVTKMDRLGRHIRKIGGPGRKRKQPLQSQSPTFSQN